MGTCRSAYGLLFTAAMLLSVSTGEADGRSHGKKNPCSVSCPWAGIYPTVLTPLCPSGGVDVASLEAQIRHELHGGVHGLLVLGTIGEGQYVSDYERAEVIGAAVRVACGVPVIVGIHTCNLEIARQQMFQAKQLGAAAALVKYIGKPKATPGEVLSFYLTLSDCRLLPILYYHYPSQTGLKLSAQDIGHILALHGIIGIKESTLNLQEVKAHIQLMHGQDKVFLSGTALNLTQFLALGGAGAMCPEAVLLPGPTVQAYTAWIDGNCDVARAIQSELFEMSPILRDRPTPAGVTRIMLTSAEDHKMPAPMGHDQPQARLKAALNCMVVPTPTVVKCPLPQLTARELKRVHATVHKLNEIDWAACSMPVPPVPLHACPSSEDQGMLLRTGAFQLGSGVGKDLLRSQGDGEGR